MATFGRTLDAVLARIDQDELVGLLVDLVRFPTINPPGDYAEIARYLERLFRDEMNLEVRVADGAGGRPNITAVLPGAQPAGGLCLSGHTDVVGPGDEKAWKYPPFSATVKDGIVWGRGTADSKGMLVGMIATVRAIQRAEVPLARDLYLTAAVDDETAGRYGLRYAFEVGQIPARALILGEATDFDVGHVFKGRIWFELETHGKVTHGAFPEPDHNAILKAVRAIDRFTGFPLGAHPLLGPDTLNVGTIHGGTVVNQGPGDCRFTLDIRWGPPRTSRDIRAQVGEILSPLAAEDPNFKVSEMRVSEERDPLDFSADLPLIRALKEHGPGLLGRDVRSIGWYSSGEIYHAFKAGNIDQGCMFGPGLPWLAHHTDEHLKIEDLVSGARAYAAAALALCTDLPA